MFFVVPGYFLGVSSLFTGGKALTTLGCFVVIITFAILVRVAYFFKYQDGNARIVASFSNRQTRSSALISLPDDIAFLKGKYTALAEHTGLPEEDGEGEDEGNNQNKDSDPVYKNSSEGGNEEVDV